MHNNFNNIFNIFKSKKYSKILFYFLSTKNSTSVVELLSMKSDTINYSNTTNRIRRKESYFISSPDGRAT